MGFDLLSLGKKISGFADRAIGLGHKYAGRVEGIASKVAAGAGTLAAGAAAIGLEPIAAGLGGIAGIAYGVEKGAHAIGGGLDKAEKISGVARKGIERVDKGVKGYKKIKGAISDVAGAFSGARRLVRP